MNTRGTTRIDTWLTKLLWAFAKQMGGEIRIPGIDLDDVPPRCAISTEYDSVTHEFVIRASNASAEMIVINTEEQWTRRDQIPTPSETRSTSSSATEPPNGRSRRVVVDDEMAAAIEQRLQERISSRNRRREEQLKADAYRDQ